MQAQKAASRLFETDHNLVERLQVIPWKGYFQGIILTLTLSILARELVQFPFLSIMGAMVLSILLGIIWRSTMGLPSTAAIGVAFSSKWLLRAGIILMGLRLNVQQIIQAGVHVIAIDTMVVLFTFLFMCWIGKMLKLPRDITILTGIGTAVCGAAAIVVIAPIIKAKKETTAIAVSIIAVMGTIATILYTFVYPYLPLNNYVYGVLVGSTLHELAHVIAAGDVGGEISGKIAILVKLGRVALLIPAALIIGYWFSRQEMKNGASSEQHQMNKQKIPFPYFILGFLALSIVNSLGWLSEELTQSLILLGVFLLSMAMAGLGLSVSISNIKNDGRNGFLICLIGTIALAIVGIGLIHLFY
jgi:uncharacterized integral membrane protein (TIGR00698 family)